VTESQFPLTSVVGPDSFVIAHLERIEQRRNVDVPVFVPANNSFVGNDSENAFLQQPKTSAGV
jgi:hypothetical protein